MPGSERGVGKHSSAVRSAPTLPGPTATRSAYLRTGVNDVLARLGTEVKEVLTLLVKARQSISNTMGIRFARGMASVALTFKHRMYARFSGPL